jgi:hypothetical protein
MSENRTPPRRDLFGRPFSDKPRWERRQERIREEIARNRRGEYTVPTWVLAVALAAIVLGFVAFVALV